MKRQFVFTPDQHGDILKSLIQNRSWIDCIVNTMLPQKGADNVLDMLASMKKNNDKIIHIVSVEN